MSVKLLKKIARFSPCQDAQDWLANDGFVSAQDAWNNCERGDWMLWLLGKLSGKPESAKRKKLVKATCGCARLALKFVKAGENRPRICIETAEAWADGKATIGQVRKARSAAAAAYAAADAAYAAYAAAAYAAADAAYAAADAAAAAAADAAADAAAADAAYAAADADAAARKQMLKDCADVVRKHYPKAPKL